MKGGTPSENAAREILSGQDTGPLKEAIGLNAGAALLVSGKTETLKDGNSRHDHCVGKSDGVLESWPANQPDQLHFNHNARARWSFLVIFGPIFRRI